MILTRTELQKLIFDNGSSPLIRNAPDLSTQLQGAGIDLTLKSIEQFSNQGTIGLYNSERKLATTFEIDPTIDNNNHIGWTLGGAGRAYKIKFNELVNIPNHIIARGEPRSSLLRNGIDIRSALFDAGYKGEVECIMLVHNIHGARLLMNARILQLIFEELIHDTVPYSGIYRQSDTNINNVLERTE